VLEHLLVRFPVSTVMTRRAKTKPDSSESPPETRTLMTFPPTRAHMLVHMGATEDAD